MSLSVFTVPFASSQCTVPVVIRGAWFSFENGKNTLTEFDPDTMSGRGRCILMKEEYHVNYTFVFQNQACYSCVKILVRTVNVLEKTECKVQGKACDFLQIVC